MCFHVCVSLSGNMARAHSSLGTNRTVVIAVINEHVTDKGKKATHRALKTQDFLSQHTPPQTKKAQTGARLHFITLHWQDEACRASTAVLCLHDYVVNIHNILLILAFT